MPNENNNGQDPSQNGNGQNPNPKENDNKQDGSQNPTAGSQNTDNFENWTEEQRKQALEFAYKSDRFKELLDADKKLKKFESEQAKLNEDKMKEQGQFKELVEQKDKEIETLRSQMKSSVLQNAIIIEAQKLGIQDTDAAVKLIDSNSIEFDENGQPKNVAEVVSDLAKNKPYLVGSNSNTPPANIGAGSNPKPPTGGKATYKLSELRRNMQDHKWYKDNESEITLAFKEGRVINDEA